MKLAAVTVMIRTFYEQTAAVPVSITLPGPVYDALHAECAKVATVRITEGMWGHWPIRGQLPRLELETGHGPVRIERAADDRWLDSDG